MQIRNFEQTYYLNYPNVIRQAISKVYPFCLWISIKYLLICKDLLWHLLIQLLHICLFNYHGIRLHNFQGIRLFHFSSILLFYYHCIHLFGYYDNYLFDYSVIHSFNYYDKDILQAIQINQKIDYKMFCNLFHLAYTVIQKHHAVITTRII